MSRVLSLTTMGVPLDVELLGDNAEEVYELAIGAWSRCLRDDGTAAEVTSSLDTSPGVRQALHDLSPVVTVTAIDARIGRLLMIHAGAVEVSAGRALAFVAHSGGGKTTLTRELARSFGYLSDETVAINPNDLTIEPHPKPLSILEDGDGFKRQVSPDALGFPSPVDRPRLARIVVLERSDEWQRGPELLPVGTLEAITMLAPQISALSALPQPLAALADALESSGGLQRVKYREASDLTPLVEGWAAT